MTVPTNTGNYYSNMWQCPSCRTWIPTGQSHACSPTQYYTPSWYWVDPAVLERIAKALEIIASQLTMRATDTPQASPESDNN